MLAFTLINIHKRHKKAVMAKWEVWKFRKVDVPSEFEIQHICKSRVANKSNVLLQGEVNVTN